MNLKLSSKKSINNRTKWEIKVDPYIVTVFQFDNSGDRFTKVQACDPMAPDITQLSDGFYVSFNSCQKFGVKDRQLAIDKFNRAIDIAKELEENIDALCA